MRISILLIVSYLATGSVNAQLPAPELKLIQVTFRHGERAPSYRARAIYTLDPYVNDTWYPEGWTGLTNNGKKSAYELGVFLREMYGHWLGDVYLQDNVKFLSSIPPRVIMSTQLIAAGLFPPSEIQRWNSELNWQPIPVYMESANLPIFSLSQKLCPKYKAMRRELEQTDHFLIQRIEELKGFFDFVSTNAGTKVGQSQAFDIYHQLNSEFSANLELPEWTRGIFPEGKLEEVAAYEYVIQSYNKSMIQLNGGLFIRQWLKRVDDHLNGSQSNDVKGHFYGGHETNIAAILAALGVFELHVPFYNSAVILELYGAGNEYYVKALYRNRGLLEELLIPGCGSINCPLPTFRRIFDDIVVQDPVALCQEVRPLSKQTSRQ